MRVLVVYCHPVAENFAAAHQVVLEAPSAARHEVTDVDLYAERFDPVMSRPERLHYLDAARNERLVHHYDDQLARAEALVLLYPAWWYGTPAMLKGYFGPVWLPGVAFDLVPGWQGRHRFLKQLPRIGVVIACDGSWWLVALPSATLPAS